MKLNRRTTLKILPALSLTQFTKINIAQASIPNIYHSLDYCAINNVYTQNSSIQEVQKQIPHILETRKIGTLNVMPVTSRSNHVGVRLTIGSGARYIDGNNQKVGYSWGKQSFTLDIKTDNNEQLKLFTTTATDTVTGKTVDAAWVGVLIADQIVYLAKTHARGLADTFKVQDKILYENFWQDPNRVIQPNHWYTFYADDFGMIEYWQ